MYVCVPACPYVHRIYAYGSQKEVTGACKRCSGLSALCWFQIEAVTFGATERAQSVRMLAKPPNDVSSSLRIQKVNRDIQLMRLVL